MENRFTRFIAEKKATRISAGEENLFALLDTNYARVFGKECSWDRLAALDKELTPGCIFTEIMDYGAGEMNLLTHTPSRELFPRREQTLVFKCKTKEGALDGARLLDKIFSGSGTRFIAEEAERKGENTFRIRTNMNASQRELLSLFCDYRFKREKSPYESKAVMENVQHHIDDYLTHKKFLEGSNFTAKEGIPAFVNVMGLSYPMPLAPSWKKRHSDREFIHHMEQMLNTPDEHGTPHMFHDIAMHVDITSDRQVHVFFDPHKHAFRQAGGVVGMFDMFMQSLASGNPAEPGAPAGKRAVATIGALAAGYAMIHFGSNIGDLITYLASDLVTFSGGAVILVGAVVNGHLKDTKRIDVAKNEQKPGEKEETLTLQSETTGRKVVVRPEDLGKGIEALEGDTGVGAKVQYILEQGKRTPAMDAKRDDPFTRG